MAKTEEEKHKSHKEAVRRYKKYAYRRITLEMPVEEYESLLDFIESYNCVHPDKQFSKNGFMRCAIRDKINKISMSDKALQAYWESLTKVPKQ